jgi:hypothetical protein
VLLGIKYPDQMMSNQCRIEFSLCLLLLLKKMRLSADAYQLSWEL